MILKSYAKLNLSLSVSPLNPETKLHPIESVMQTISLCDDIEITPKKKQKTTTLEVSGAPYVALPPDFTTNNLILKAMQTFQHLIPHAFHIKLHKRIPLGAGLGGGSSNVATCLMALNTLLKWKKSHQDLFQMGMQLGSDIPFFFIGNTCHISGYGEKIQSIDTPQNTHFVLICPPINANTATVYNQFDKFQKEEMTKSIGKDHCTNDLLKAACTAYPTLNSIYKTLKTTLGYAPNMSGSGATFFIATADAKTALTLIQKLTPILPTCTLLYATTQNNTPNPNNQTHPSNISSATLSTANTH